MHLTRNQTYLYGYRGFESLTLRHFSCRLRAFILAEGVYKASGLDAIFSQRCVMDACSSSASTRDDLDLGADEDAWRLELTNSTSNPTSTGRNDDTCISGSTTLNNDARPNPCLDEGSIRKNLTLAFAATTLLQKEIQMKRSLQLFVWSALFLSVALPLHAQDGCDDSPENPTAVLALVGGAGALFSTLRGRYKARRSSSGR
jgi:XrtJ-associated TM-motif-TM protein